MRVYTKKKNLFKDYVLRNNKVSKKYITTVNAELKFEYYHNLMSPRDGEMGSEEIFFNNPDGIYSAINREFNSKENGFFDATKYFENISFDEFKRPDLINNSYYKQSLVDYIRNYFVSQDYLHYNEESFLRELKFIDDNLDGELANYAKVHVISDYYKKGFGITSKNRALLKKTIEKVKKEYGENLYSEKLTDISSDLELAKNDFTAKVLKVKLLNIKGDTILFKDVLKENSHDVKILDFWASWCVPCIEDIKSTTTFKKELKNENNVDFIYLSIDANKDQWRSRSLELKNYFQTENQYLLVEGDKSAIAKYLKVTFIPRYAILNKSNNIEYARAPKPSDSLVFKKLILNVNR